MSNIFEDQVFEMSNILLIELQQDTHIQHLFNIFLNCSCQEDIYCKHYLAIFKICKKHILDKVKHYWINSQNQNRQINSYADLLATGLYMSMIHHNQPKNVENIQSNNTEIGNKQNPQQNLLEQPNK